MKYCKDCKYNEFSILAREFECLHSAVISQPNVVTGRCFESTESCKHYRHFGKCRNTGIYWEPSRWYRFKLWLGITKKEVE